MPTWAQQLLNGNRPTGWRGSLLLGGLLTLAMRVGLGLLMAAIWLTISKHLDPVSLESFNRQAGIGLPSTRLGQALLGVWVRWDAVHYLRLAELGYQGAGVGSSAFYPLYPLLTGLTARATPFTTLASGLLISTLGCWATLSLLHQLSSQQLDPSIGLWATVSLAVFPTSFFLLGPYTESIFLALILGALLAAYGQRWWLAGSLAALGSLARGPGLLTAIPLAWIGWQQRTQQNPRSLMSFVPPALASLAAILPGFAFQYWRQWQGFPPLQETLEIYSRQQIVGPFRGIALALRQLVSQWEFLPALEAGTALLAAVLTVVLLLQPRLRKPEWFLFQAANLLLFISFHAAEASAWRSMARYVLSLFPSFIVFGFWLERGNQPRRFLYLTISSSALVVLSSLFAMFWFIG